MIALKGDWLICEGVKSHLLLKISQIASIDCSEAVVGVTGIKQISITANLISGQTVNFEFDNSTSMWDCRQVLKKLSG
jgi:hypothetical protein